jgi:hypothetical protein
MSDKFESQHSNSNYLVRRESGYLKIFFTFLEVNMSNILYRYFIAIIYMRLWVFKHHFSTIFQLYIDLWATFPGANMVQGRNILGYLRTRTFYTPERKYAYKYASITKCSHPVSSSILTVHSKCINAHTLRSDIFLPKCPTHSREMFEKFESQHSNCDYLVRRESVSKYTGK